MSFKPLVSGPPEAIYFDFPETLIGVKPYGKYVLFDLYECKQLTEYVEQPFRKEWGKGRNNYIVVNEEAGIKSQLDLPCMRYIQDICHSRGM